MYLNKFVDNSKPLIKSIQYIKDINHYVSNMSYEDFSNDSKTVDACITKFTQLGEMVSRVTDDFKKNHDNISWSEIKGLRNIVVHNYDAINYKSIWNTINEDLPELYAMYNQILKDEFNITIDE